jgi:FkbM family methyltransferase
LAIHFWDCILIEPLNSEVQKYMPPTTKRTFLADYIHLVAEAIDADHCGNHDFIRFGPEQLTARDFPRQLVKLQQNGQETEVDSGLLTVHRAMQLIQNCLPKLEWLYAKLGDSKSRQTLVEVTAFRALGHRKIKVAVNNPQHDENLKIAEKLVCSDEVLDVEWNALNGMNSFQLNRMNLTPIGYPIELYWSPYATVIDFIEEQYACKSENGDICCEPGDYVIDGGACWGDTALYFAVKAGKEGKVFSFEFNQENIAVFQKNLSLNPTLSENIRHFSNALWSKSGETLSFAPGGPGTALSAPMGSSDSRVKTMHIDWLVGSGAAKKIDFIKMDIEGAELQALKGAEQTIKKFRPKLAITVYHHFQDFWTIPQYIDSLGLGYRFEMRHFTIHAEETLIYAKVS